MTHENTKQNATVASEVNIGDVAVEAKAADVAAASEQAVSAPVPECRATDTSCETVQAEVKAPATRSSLAAIANEVLAKDPITVKVIKYQEPKSPVMMPFNRLVISQWNPSATGTRSEEAIDNLMKDIKSRGLINPILIANAGKDSNGESKFTVIAGAGRLAALKKLRGEASGLMEKEFNLATKLDEEDEKCAGICLAENFKRSNHSHLTMAEHLCMLVKEKSITESKLANYTNMRRDGINRYVKLGEHVAKLPESWVKDLKYTQPIGGKKVKKNDLPRITFAHWETVAGLVGKKGDESTVQKLLTDTYEGKWKVSKLRTEMRERFPECKGTNKGRPGFGKKAGKDPAADPAQGKDATPAEVTQAEPTQAVVEKPQDLNDEELEMIRQYRAKKAA